MEQLYCNGTVLTMADETDRNEALLVRDGIIKYVGSQEEAEQLAAPDAERVDLHGCCLMPAFLDPHSHLVLAAQFFAMADLSGCETFAQIRQVLSSFIVQRGLTQADAVMGVGYDHNFLKEKAHPDRTLLDQVSKGIPIYISHASGHMGVANTAALNAAGLTRDTPDPQDGKYGRDKDGSLTGYLEEVTAVGNMMQRLSLRIKFNMEELICKAQELYAKHGIATCQDGAAGPDNIRFLHQMAEKRKLKLDVIAYAAATMEPEQVFASFADCDRVYYNHFKIGGLKMILDGSPQGKTAWLTEHYAGTQDKGRPAMADAEAGAVCRYAVETGRQLLAHCNGDAASDQFLRCYQGALKQVKRTVTNDLRPVMVHCQTIRTDQLEQMKQCAMIPSMFVAHTYYWGDVHLKNLGHVRGNRISPAREAFDLGLKVNFHQDTPVLPPDMIETVWCAVNRRTKNGVSIGKEQAVTVFEALQAVTTNAAYAYFEEERKGMLKEGYRADLVLLSENPLECPPEALRRIQVLETRKDGNVVFCKEADAAQVTIQI